MTAGTKPWTTWSWPGTPCVASLRLAPSSCYHNSGQVALLRRIGNKKKRKRNPGALSPCTWLKYLEPPFSCRSRFASIYPRQLLIDDEDHPRLSPCSRTTASLPSIFNPKPLGKLQFKFRFIIAIYFSLRSRCPPARCPFATSRPRPRRPPASTNPPPGCCLFYLFLPFNLCWGSRVAALSPGW
jgi:hypothetical protein